MSKTLNNLSGATEAAVSLKSSMFQNEFSTLDDFYSNIDHRINSKLAQSMKRAILLIIEEVDLHLSNKMELLIEAEVDKKVQSIFSDATDFRNGQHQSPEKKESTGQTLKNRWNQLQENLTKFKRMTTPNFNRIQQRVDELSNSLQEDSNDTSKQIQTNQKSLDAQPEITDASSMSTNILRDQDNESLPNRPGEQLIKRATIKQVEVGIEKSQQQILEFDSVSPLCTPLLDNQSIKEPQLLKMRSEQIMHKPFQFEKKQPQLVIPDMSLGQSLVSEHCQEQTNSVNNEQNNNQIPKDNQQIEIKQFEIKEDAAAAPIQNLHHRHRDTFGNDGDFNFRTDSPPPANQDIGFNDFEQQSEEGPSYSQDDGGDQDPYPQGILRSSRLSDQRSHSAHSETKSHSALAFQSNAQTFKTLNMDQEYGHAQCKTQRPVIVPPLQLPLNESAFDSPVLPKQNRQKCGMILQDALKRSNPPSNEAVPTTDEVVNIPEVEMTPSQNNQHEFSNLDASNLPQINVSQSQASISNLFKQIKNIEQLTFGTNMINHKISLERKIQNAQNAVQALRPEPMKQQIDQCPPSSNQNNQFSSHLRKEESIDWTTHNKEAPELLPEQMVSSSSVSQAPLYHPLTERYELPQPLVAPTPTAQQPFSFTERQFSLDHQNTEVYSRNGGLNHPNTSHALTARTTQEDYSVVSNRIEHQFQPHLTLPQAMNSMMMASGGGHKAMQMPPPQTPRTATTYNEGQQTERQRWNTLMVSQNHQADQSSHQRLPLHHHSNLSVSKSQVFSQSQMQFENSNFSTMQQPQEGGVNGETFYYYQSYAKQRNGSQCKTPRNIYGQGNMKQAAGSGYYKQVKKLRKKYAK